MTPLLQDPHQAERHNGLAYAGIGAGNEKTPLFAHRVSVIPGLQADNGHFRAGTRPVLVDRRPGMPVHHLVAGR